VSVAGATRFGDFDEAAAFGDVILYTVRDALPSTLLKEPQVLSKKIVIDCNNSAMLGFDTPDPEGRSGIHFVSSVPSLAERLAADIRQARVVKAFNTIPRTVIELGRATIASHHITVFLCSDDSAAKSTVSTLAKDLGFAVVDSGELERAQLVESVADFLRFQILGMNLGLYATLSIDVLKEPK
jgi:hypothetical protein